MPRRAGNERQIASLLRYLDATIGGDPAELRVTELECRGRRELVGPRQPRASRAMSLPVQLPDGGLGLTDEIWQ